VAEKQNKTIHLICNSHIDPVWLWDWEEGASVTLATFRTAAKLCDEFDGFVFNHNEAILYQWIEEYEPILFKKIQRLVKEGKWRIMGGWYLQPDCNMPLGESFVRQVLLGKKYFKEKFNTTISTAINLDPFGHTRGLVQILKKSGYDSYLFCRPGMKDCALPAAEFTWVGYDGSEIIGTLATAHYNSTMGEAGVRLEAWIKENPDKRCSALLWGVGNHGGGPSKKDLNDLSRLINNSNAYEIRHSFPEAYFKELKRRKKNLPRYEDEINPWAVGCYTSMAKVKEKHRRLENELFMVEKIATVAAFQGLIHYPETNMKEAMKDLARSEFHDALPGSGTPAVEDSVIRTIDHGLEILARVKAASFFALTTGQKSAGKSVTPIVIYNHHPWKADALIECEIEEPEPNFTKKFIHPRIMYKGKVIPCQEEKEQSNLNQDFRKKVVFSAPLEPSSMNRFDCYFDLKKSRPCIDLKVKKGRIIFRTKSVEIHINTTTGLVDRYKVDGVDCLKKKAFLPIVMEDNPDPWGQTVKRFRKPVGRFKLASMTDCAALSGISSGRSLPVKVIEDGPVRSIVEAVFTFRKSAIVQKYKLSKHSDVLEVETRVFWNEKDKMLKLSIPTVLDDGEYLGQAAYGRQKLKTNGDEVVFQKWCAVVPRKNGIAVSVINDRIYGSDMKIGEIRLSLLRSPAYSWFNNKAWLAKERERFIPRQDQGERIFRFWVCGGPAKDRLKKIDHEAMILSESPFALPFFPSGDGQKQKKGIVLSNETVMVTAIKKAEAENNIIIRLFEPTGFRQVTLITLPWASAKSRITLAPFEIKTLKFNVKKKTFIETNLIEERVKSR